MSPPSPVPKRELIFLPDIVRSARPPHPEPIYILTAPITVESLYPAAGTRLAYDAALARTLDVLARNRTAAARALIDAIRDGRRPIDELDAVTPADKRSDPIYVEQRAKLEAKRDARVAKATTKHTDARDKLIAKLDAQQTALTAAGALLRAGLLSDRAYERFEAIYEAYLVNPSGSEPVPDHRETIAAVDLVLSRDPDEPLHAAALYIQADARSASKDPDEIRAATRTFLEIVKSFPTSPVVEACYQRAADNALADSEPESRANAFVALRWLVTNATSPDRKVAARYRLARLHDATRDRGASRDLYCQLVDDPAARDLIDSVSAHLASGLFGDLETLRNACAAKRCPCTAGVIDNLSHALISYDDDERAREVLELGLVAQADQPQTSEWLCRLAHIHDRAAQSDAAAKVRASRPAGAPTCPVEQPMQDLGTPSEIAARYAKQNRTIQRCFEDGLERGKWTQATARVEVLVDKSGKVERATATASTFDPETTACLEQTIARHRFRGISFATLVIPIRFDPP